jgi:hypothetical protein
MTTIAINVGFSIAQAIADFFSGIGKSMVMARGTHANYEVAQHLQHEYPNMSQAEIAHMLNDRLRKEVYGA